ncbi:MAG: methyltransferase domain-containing protein [Terracidiphilus sp.]|jgi:SAM-dependent methyltransferase
MPFDVIDFRHRAELAELTEFMDEPCSRDQLRACLRDLARLNRWFLAYRPLLDWLNTVAPPSASRPLHIVDVGCGYGDALRRIERWARTRGVAVELTGIDLNPDAVIIAAEASPPQSTIRWIATDVFAFQPEKPVHLVVSSLFTHHLTESDLIRFLQWMEFRAEFGWFINDLSRAAVPYHLLRMFSKLAGLHPFVQHDGPVSIARSFVPKDWQQMCSDAGLDLRAASIRPSWPARLCVSRRKTP